jgi:hypothetical protein
MVTNLITGNPAISAVQPYQILKYSGNGGVAPAAGPTDKLIGVSGSQPVDSGYAVDVARTGIAEVKLGGTVSAGDDITSDANGRGVALTGAGQSVGRAEKDGVEGDVIPVLVLPVTKSSST